MGSLMAGWNCPVLNPETAQLERNRSLTKEEIESFWKVRRKCCDDREDLQEEHAPSPSAYSPGPKSPLHLGGGGGGGGESEAVRRNKSSVFWQSLEKIKTTLPGGSGDESESPLGADKVAKLTGDWWTRSTWAFLNESPRDGMQSSSHRYAAQFHVAEIGTASRNQPAH